MDQDTNTDSSNLLLAAFEYAERGVPVFPCHQRSKAPLIDGGFKAASTDAEQIRSWWSQQPGALIGMPTGQASGLVVLDADSREAMAEFEIMAEESGAPLPRTYRVRTHRGVHVYFEAPKDVVIPSSVSKAARKLDVRGDGGYVIVPPSPHPNGGRYEVIDPSEPVPLPTWLLVLLQRGPVSVASATEISELRATIRYRAYVNKLRQAQEGERNATLNLAAWFAGRLAKHPLFPQDKTEAEIRDAALSIGLNRGEVNSTFVSGWSSGLEKPLKVIVGYNCTDAGNAERLIARHSDALRYSGPERQWYVWDDKRWAASDHGEAGRLALETARSIYAEAATVEDDDKREALARWAAKSENAPQVLNMLKLAGMHPTVAIIPQELDVNPWLLTVENCTLDLKTQVAREHRREDLVSKMVHVKYEPRASCPTWTKHLETVQPNPAIRSFLQRAVGYSLTGLDVEEVFFFLHGDGQTGKSKTLETISLLLGELSWTASFGSFVKGQGGPPLNVIADMIGRRVVVADESDEDQSFNEAMLKNLTGGGNVSGRQLYTKTINYRPTFKLWFGSNYKPAIRSSDLAIWRRVRMIPFNVRIPEEQRDRFLMDKFKGEMSGILNWALAGLVEWQKSGLAAPDEVKDATRAYRSEMDVIKEFVEDRYELVKDASVRLSEMYTSFRSWSEGNGDSHPVGRRAFGERLRKMGLDINERDHSRPVYGVRPRASCRAF